MQRKSFQCLTQSHIAVLDGAMGRHLLGMGLPSTKLWSALALTESKYHDYVIQAHTDYLNSDCDIITTNNFSVSPFYGISDFESVSKLTKLSVSLANKARENYYCSKRKINNNYNKNIYIAGCVPPLSQCYRPELTLSKQDSIDQFTIILQSLLSSPSQIDIILAETLSTLTEAQCIIETMANLKLDDDDIININQTQFDIINTKQITLPVIFSFTIAKDGVLHSGDSFNDVIEYFCSSDDCRFLFGNGNCNNNNIDRFRLEMLSMNCGTCEDIEKCLDSINNKSFKLLDKYNIKLGVYPNGFDHFDKPPQDSNVSWVEMPTRKNYSEAEYLYQEFIKKWINNRKYGKYIRMVGGCCAVYPKHIQYIANQIKLGELNDQQQAHYQSKL